MKNLDFEWLTDEFMLYCRSTQLRAIGYSLIILASNFAVALDTKELPPQERGGRVCMQVITCWRLP